MNIVLVCTLLQNYNIVGSLFIVVNDTYFYLCLKLMWNTAVFCTIKCVNCKRYIFFPWRKSPGSGPPHCRGLAITLSHTTLDRTPPGEWSGRRRIFYPTRHNTHKRQISTPPSPPEGFEVAIPASERPQTHALDRAATAIGTEIHAINELICFKPLSVMVPIYNTVYVILYISVFCLTNFRLIILYDPDNEWWLFVTNN